MEPEKSKMDGKDYKTLKEGSAYILLPEGPQDVFYNPIQQFNRDLSVLAIRAFGEDSVARTTLKPSRRSRRRKHSHNANDGRSTGLTEPERETDEDPPAKRQKLDFENDASASEIIHAEKVNPSNGANEETHKLRRIKILDALSATGLRALRYAKELPFNTVITANDKSKGAAKAIKDNVAHNGLDEQITVSTANAQAYMYARSGDDESRGSPREKYDVIDLDPYGTAVPFLDAAVQALKYGGLLCVTCTDAGVYASCGYIEKTYSLYGGLPIKGFHSHEGGIRLILHAISSTAARYGLAVEPLLSLSIDFYVRLFVRIKRSPADVKFLAGKTMLVYNCDSGCGAWSTQYLARNAVQSDKNPDNIAWKHSCAQAPNAPPNCPHCGFKTHLAGPMFGGPLHNPAFIERILAYLPELDKTVYQTSDRIEGMLITALEECETVQEPTPAHKTKDLSITPVHQPHTTSGQNEEIAEETSSPASSPLIPSLHPALVDSHPFYFSPSVLSKVLHCSAPSDAQLKGALRGLGYRCLRSHTKPGTIRTDAPWEAIWRVMRTWVRQEARVRPKALREGTAGWGILQRGEELGEDGDYFVENGGVGKGDEGKRWEALMEKLKRGRAGAEKADSVGENSIDTAIQAGAEQAGNTGGEDPSTKNPKIVFDEELGKDDKVGGKRLKRYQTNPRPNWGPMSRAKAASVQQ